LIFIYFRSINYLINEFELEWEEELDYILWVDTDTVFVDFEFKLENIIHKYPHAHIIFSGIYSCYAYIYTVYN
jgi:hypothetical protein